jgi:transcriptional regulator with XRE-family HTH domain
MYAPEKVSNYFSRMRAVTGHGPGIPGRGDNLLLARSRAMTLAEMLKKNRELSGMTSAELAAKLGVSERVVECLENPGNPGAEAIEFFAGVFGFPVDVFTGKVAARPKEIHKNRLSGSRAKYPFIRDFLLNPSRCKTPDTAISCIGADPFPLVERNVVLYLSTMALYNFCDTNTSNFSFDTYLFKHHGRLLQKFEAELAGRGLDPQDREEQLNLARGDIFRCDRIENIAILVLDDFAAELEQKLADGTEDYGRDLQLPFSWEVDDTLMKIVIRDGAGGLLHQIRLLDVKGRDAKPA